VAALADRARLIEVAHNLLSLEVNTILKENMTGERMPPIPHALLDVAGEYARVLLRDGVRLSLYFPPAIGNRTPEEVEFAWGADTFSTDLLTVSRETFDSLRWAAKRANLNTATAPAPLARGELILLERICSNCDTIKEILKRPAAAALTADRPNRDALLAKPIPPESYAAVPLSDLISVRKIWDIGTEQIVAQTVIQLNGDVLTRVQEWVREPGAETLFAVHRQSIDIAVASWRHLLDVVAEVAGSAVSTLIRR
jgi:hypothetical protein